MPALGLSARGIVVARGLGARKSIAGELLHSGALIPLASGILLLVLLWSLLATQVANDLEMTEREIIRKNDQPMNCTAGPSGRAMRSVSSATASAICLTAKCSGKPFGPSRSAGCSARGS